MQIDHYPLPAARLLDQILSKSIIASDRPDGVTYNDIHWCAILNGAIVGSTMRFTVVLMNWLDFSPPVLAHDSEGCLVVVDGL